MAVPFFSGADVERAVSPHEAYDAVKAGVVAHARGEWTMPPKLYVTNYPAGRLPGDARARRRARAAEVGDVVPREPGAGVADRDRARVPLRRRDRSAARRSSTRPE